MIEIRKFPKRIVILGTLFVLLIILAVCFIRYEGKEKIKQSSITPPPDIYKPTEELKERKKVVLFFLSEDDPYLHPEEREIYSSSVSSEAKQLIEELIRGSQKGFLSPLPPQTKLRELFVTDKGVAYVDLSKDLKGGYPYGSSSEISTIYSIVNSLTYNFESIKKVFILIEGGEKETLGGHIGLRKPFSPQYSLIAK